MAHDKASEKKESDKFLEAKLLTRRCLNPGSSKQTYHIELEVPGLNYRCGDSLAIIPSNPKKLLQPWVDRYLQIRSPSTNQDPDSLYQRLSEGDLYRRLKDDIELTSASTLTQSKLLTLMHSQPKGDTHVTSISDSSTLHADALNSPQRVSQLEGMDLIDLLTDLDPHAQIPLDLILPHLPKLKPRYYSIASSQLESPMRLALTVAHVSYSTTKKRWGACSTYLCCECPLGGRLNVYLHPSRRFALPSDDSDLIMIGPGTGVAPFRGFLRERAAKQSAARHWLFFGGRYAHLDNYYGDEWKKLTQVLDLRVTNAFSRDQERKIYVQDRLWEQRHQLWEWLESGAQLYLCGDAQYMAKDVERTLGEIASRLGSISEPKQWIRQMLRSGRYQRDIY